MSSPDLVLPEGLPNPDWGEGRGEGEEGVGLGRVLRLGMGEKEARLCLDGWMVGSMGGLRFSGR